jgi:aminobenzoyl-glutamate utilization protein B
MNSGLWPFRFSPGATLARSAVMTAVITTAAGLASAASPAAAAPVKPPIKPMFRGAPVAEKQAAAAAVERQAADMTSLSDQIWGFAETALRETRSSKVLADYAERQGFKVERGVAGMPTAFVATYGEGKPVIGILGEFDALPGISQKAEDHKEPLEAGAPGHGCGHNLFGVASLGAAVAIKEQIAAGKRKGTVRFYGTPAEESVGGKAYMAREGLFDDLDVALAWHPDSGIRADTKSSQAIADLLVEFKGKAAHAAYDPWNGRSALDAASLFTHAIDLMREHVRPSVRMHYVVKDGGQVPNVVPEKATVWLWLRDSHRTEVDELLARAKKAAQGAAMAAEVEGQVKVQAGSWEMLVNLPGERLLHDNLAWLGPLRFTEEEQTFAKKIQATTGVPQKGLDGTVQPLDENPGDPEGGSTDVADVSWIVPVIHLSVTTAPVDAPWHAWPVVACAGMSIGHKGMLYASKALAATGLDLLADPAALAAVQKDFKERKGDVVYKGYIPEGPPPVPAPAPAP